MSSLLEFLVVTASAAAVSAVATPLFGALATRMGLIVAPREDRWHRRPTPLLGGAAMALAVLVILAALVPIDRTSLALVACAAAAFAFGLLDDFRRFAPTTKLVGQVLVAALLVYGGVIISIIPFAPIEFVLTVFWVVAMMNAVNLIDNMDGLAAGITAIAALVLGLTAMPQNPEAALLAAVTAGTALGFLTHNFYPARVFMGDSGSMLLGFLLAATALLHTARGAANLGLAVFGPLVVLALPIFDTALVTASRRFAGRPISRGGRDHTSHRLAALGLSDRGAVIFLYVVAATLAGVAAIADAASSFGLPLFALACVSLILFGIFLHEVDVYGKREEPEAVGADQPSERIVSSIYVYLRFGFEVGLDVVLLTVAYYVSYLVKYEGVPESGWMPYFAQSAPAVIGAQLVALVAMRTYRTLWRYLGVADAVNIVRAVSVGSGIAVLVVLLAWRFEGFSRAVFLSDWLLASALLIGSRSFALWLRHWFALRPREGERRVLVAGATESGAIALRLLSRAMATPHRAIGFVDEDPSKRYRRIDGVPILGSVSDLESVIGRHSIDLVVIALERNEPLAEQVRQVCRGAGVECREFLAPV